MRREKRVFFSILSLQIIWVLIGCAAVRDYYVSKPLNQKSEVFTFWPNGIVHLAPMSGVDLFVRPNNIFNVSEGVMGSLPVPPVVIMRDQKNKKFDELYKVKSFYVEVLIKVKENGYFFNPMKIFCQLEGGGSLPASGYIKPDRRFRSPNRHGMFTLLMPIPTEYSWRDEINEIALYKDYKIEKGEWAGYLIRFDIAAPEPGMKFSLEVNGLKREENIPIPKIKYFGKSNFRDIHT